MSELWVLPGAPVKIPLCIHLGEQVGTRPCQTCIGKVELKVFPCGAGHGEVTIVDCRSRGPGGGPCPDYVSRPA